MTVDAQWTPSTPPADIPRWVTLAYTATYRGPHSEAPEADTQPDDTVAIQRSAVMAVTPAMLGAHCRLAQHRPAGDSKVAVYAADDPGGFGPALQVITEYGAPLMDSLAVLLHRLGVAYVGIMNPVFTVRRDPAGQLLSVAPKTDERGGGGAMRPGSTSGWRRRWTRRRWPRPAGCCPM
ncbi:NAD-specific glutamate dehydrogenase [Mycobacterium talmoniae]|uniref:NAD-specific glutamate dehydrogenase n=1 Tax=Mycobacterium talmoniae TaxID=1858794 RepID=A0A2S8BLR8_9MYCO|nr:NAD-specific glutamate dehydrogenase [Mycobacterium talmoniae]